MRGSYQPADHSIYTDTGCIGDREKEEVGSSEGGEEVVSSQGEKKWVVVRGRRSGQQ